MQSGDVHPASLSPRELLEVSEVERLRRTGPGGQHRNKVETAVRLRHRPTGVGAEASERRSQAENLRVALFRLRLNLALEIRLHGEPPPEPSPLWRSRFPASRIRISPSHHDFPSILAEALDVIAACRFDVKNAAVVLGCTASQLVKLLKKEPRAMMLVNRERGKRGLNSLG